MTDRVFHTLIKHLSICVALAFLFTANTCFSQTDSTGLSLKIDSSFLSLRIDTSEVSFLFNESPVVWVSYTSDAEHLLSHDPSKEDTLLYKKYKKLIGTGPTKKNHSHYYELACALWELKKTEEAKQMFLQILNSKESYYCGDYYHSSDLAGRKTSGSYSYGSYTSNYKHYACYSLAKIHAERKEFDEALNYIVAADTVYPLHYSCGTGNLLHRDQMLSFYILCYEGQENYKKVVDMLLPSPYYWNMASLARSVKKLYQPTAIRDSLSAAINSLVFIPDSLPTSYSSYENYGKENEVKMEITFMSGHANLCLFGCAAIMHASYMDQTKTTSREFFVKDFMKSGLYTELIKEE